MLAIVVEPVADTVVRVPSMASPSARDAHWLLKSSPPRIEAVWSIVTAPSRFIYEIHEWSSSPSRDLKRPDLLIS